MEMGEDIFSLNAGASIMLSSLRFQISSSTLSHVTATVLEISAPSFYSLAVDSSEGKLIFYYVSFLC